MLKHSSVPAFLQVPKRAQKIAIRIINFRSRTPSKPINHIITCICNNLCKLFVAWTSPNNKKLTITDHSFKSPGKAERFVPSHVAHFIKSHVLKLVLLSVHICLFLRGEKRVVACTFMQRKRRKRFSCLNCVFHLRYRVSFKECLSMFGGFVFAGFSPCAVEIDKPAKSRGGLLIICWFLRKISARESFASLTSPMSINLSKLSETESFPIDHWSQWRKKNSPNNVFIRWTLEIYEDFY